jgi:YEATS domain-containing protein 1/3
VLTLLCGYFATPREKATPEGYTHDWTAFVKGDHEKEENGSDLSHIVRKVVFQLHEDFEPNATRGMSAR